MARSMARVATSRVPAATGALGVPVVLAGPMSPVVLMLPVVLMVLLLPMALSLAEAARGGRAPVLPSVVAVMASPSCSGVSLLGPPSTGARGTGRRLREAR